MADKKKKKKVVYYDDGRTIADMSNIYGIKKADEDDGGEPKYKGNPYFGGYRPGHSPKDWAKTYWNTMKTMFLPMLATLGIIGGAFLLLYLLLLLAS
jgi:hypothetical protein